MPIMKLVVSVFVGPSKESGKDLPEEKRFKVDQISIKIGVFFLIRSHP